MTNTWISKIFKDAPVRLPKETHGLYATVLSEMRFYSFEVLGHFEKPSWKNKSDSDEMLQLFIWGSAKADLKGNPERKFLPDY